MCYVAYVAYVDSGSHIEPVVLTLSPLSLRVRVGTADIPFTTYARKLGFLISGNMTLDNTFQPSAILLLWKESE